LKPELLTKKYLDELLASGDLKEVKKVMGMLNELLR
jgi:hypothetical protein